MTVGPLGPDQGVAGARRWVRALPSPGVAPLGVQRWAALPANARRAQNFAALLQRAPRDRLLLETDCPYLSPDRERLPRNEPATVAETAEFAAELWDEPLPMVIEQFEDNYRRLFGEDPS